MTHSCLVSAQPSFIVGSTASTDDTEFSLSLHFDDGAMDVRRAAASLRYDPRRIQPANDCSFFLTRDVGESRLICVDYPDQGLIEVTINLFANEPTQILSGPLGELRFTSAHFRPALAFRPPTSVQVLDTTFLGANDIGIVEGESTDGFVYLFNDWPRDDGERNEGARFPIFTPFEGVSRQVLGGSAVVPLTFHSPNDVDWIALPGHRIGRYKITRNVDTAGFRVATFDMGRRIDDPSLTPEQVIDLCETGDENTWIEAESRSSLLLRVEPCVWSEPTVYVITIEDETFRMRASEQEVTFSGGVRRMPRQPIAVILKDSDGTASYSDPLTGFMDLVSRREISSIEIISADYLLQDALLSRSPSISIGPFPIPVSGQVMQVSPGSYSGNPYLVVNVNLPDPIFKNSFESTGQN
ncbi:MAG: hypothetical protein AAF358_11370 [Pseudomonadota bacterium]